MALKDIGERLEGKGWLGIGIGALILAPVVIPAVARGLRPLAKGAIKGYLALQEKGREVFAETSEQFQDLVAEARSEYELRDNGAEMMTLDASEEGDGEAVTRREENGGTRSRSRARKSGQPKSESA
jgi:hypothetical protein